jgi:hypothetical protein
MLILKSIHFLVGALFLLIFLATGVYMFTNFPDLYAGREEVRMMYRATHVYILFSASVNLLAGGNFHHFGNFLSRVQLLASVLILIAPFLVFAGFIVEPSSYLIDRPITFWGIVSLFIGVVLLSIINLPWATKYTI